MLLVKAYKSDEISLSSAFCWL